MHATDSQPIFQMGEDRDGGIEPLTGRLTLKTGRAFCDPERPELVFLVPRARVHGRGDWIRMGTEFSAIVYMARGDPLLVLDIDCDSVLTLLPRRHTSTPRDKKKGKVTNVADEGSVDRDDDALGDARMARVESIVLHRSGRRAELLLVPL